MRSEEWRRAIEPDQICTRLLSGFSSPSLRFQCQCVCTTPTHFRSAPLSLPFALECFVLPPAISAFSLSDRVQGWARARSEFTKGLQRLVGHSNLMFPVGRDFQSLEMLQHLPIPLSATAPALVFFLPDTLPCSPTLAGEFGHKPPTQAEFSWSARHTCLRTHRQHT